MAAATDALDDFENDTDPTIRDVVVSCAEAVTELKHLESVVAVRAECFKGNVPRRQRRACKRHEKERAKQTGEILLRLHELGDKLHAANVKLAESI